MKRVLRTTMMALLVMVLCVGMLAPTAMAAYTPVYTDEIPVTIFMESIPEGEELPVSDAIEVTIQTLSEGSPDAAPDKLVIDCLSANGDAGTTETFKLGPFDKPGLHTYGVTIGTSSNEFSESDSEVYYVVKVSVTNKEDYSGLETTVAIRKTTSDFHIDENEPKPDSITDTNYYVPPLDITVVKKWVNGYAKSVTVNLVEVADVLNEETGEVEATEIIRDTVILSKENDWQHVFEDLDPRITWKVKEEKLSDFSVSYKYNKDDPYSWVVRITNTAALYQTGQLNWPIPVLVCAGSMCMLAGMFLLRKKEEQTNE